MRYITPLFASVIFAAALAISYDHTLDLMLSAGLSGVMAHLGVVAFELSFTIGTLSLVFDSASRTAAISAIALGLSVIAAANVMAGVTYGVTGVAVGLAIPTAVVIAEVLLKSSLSHRPRGVDTADTAVTSEDDTVSPPVSSLRDKAAAVVDTVATGVDTRADTVAAARDTVDTTVDTATEVDTTHGASVATPITSVSDRRARVASMRGDGVALSDIAAELGVSVRTVQRDLTAA